MTNVFTTLYDNQPLTETEAADALLNIAAGETTPAQTASLITVYLMRPITGPELAGFRSALLETGVQVDLSDFDPMDLCGTGGDNKNTFNISTLAAFVAAGAGVPIAKHGNYSVSSSCGSSNVLEYFGYRFSADEDKLKREMATAGICFLHAPMFQPSLRAVSAIRKELRVKTFFNMLGPLINPASPNKQLLGVYSQRLAELYAGILKATELEYNIVHSLDGFDEISLTGVYRIISRYADEIYTPEEKGFRRLDPVSLYGGRSVEESAAIFHSILTNSGTEAQNDAVLVNAAAAISLYRSSMEHDESVELARASLKNGHAFSAFKKLMN